MSNSHITSEIDKIMYKTLLEAYKNLDDGWESPEEIVLMPQAYESGDSSDEEIVLPVTRMARHTSNDTPKVLS
jgi:hypothetical protein